MFGQEVNQKRSELSGIRTKIDRAIAIATLYNAVLCDQFESIHALPLSTNSLGEELAVIIELRKQEKVLEREILSMEKSHPQPNRG
jgi:hypothetical protein